MLYNAAWLSNGGCMKIDSTENVQQGREKLDRMIEDALNRGIALTDNEEIQKQSRLVEQLIEKIESEPPAS